MAVGPFFLRWVADSFEVRERIVRLTPMVRKPHFYELFYNFNFKGRFGFKKEGVYEKEGNSFGRKGRTKDRWE